MTFSTQADTSSGTNVAQHNLRALLQNVVMAPNEGLGWIRVTGEDRVRWLNGMVTNSIQNLAAGEGCFNFILSAQGRIQGTATAFAQQDSILLETDRAQVTSLMTILDRFIIMDDVELTDASNTWIGVSVIGPRSAFVLQQIGLHPAESGPPFLETIAWRGADIMVVTVHSPLISRFELWTDSATAASLMDALATADTQVCGGEAMEWLRILEGTPRYGVDIRDRELPQETGQARALHFSKGCYLGQEIVERIRSRGNVHRTFSGFRLQGTLPAPGTPVEAEGKQVGELTSGAEVPLSSETVTLGLGYIRREALDRAVPLTYAGGTALPTSLPFKDL